MTSVTQRGYAPKRMRRFNNGFGRLRFGQTADLPVDNQIEIARGIPYPAIDYAPADLVTDLSTPTVSQTDANGNIAGVVGFTTGGQNVVIRMSGLEWTALSRGNLFAVEDSAHGLAIDLEPDSIVRFIVSDSVLTFENAVQVPLPDSPSGAAELFFQLDLTAGRTGMFVLYRRAAGEPLQAVGFFPMDGLASWAGENETGAFLAAAGLTLGDGSAPADGLAATGLLQMWHNNELAGW